MEEIELLEFQISKYDFEIIEIITLAVEFFNISENGLLGKSKIEPLPFYRYCVWRVLRTFKNNGKHKYTFKIIGKIFKRDHSTILCGCKVVILPFWKDDYIKFLTFIKNRYGEIR